MRLSVSWLREFVNLKASADDIAATLGLRGFEVASIEMIGNDAVIDFEITANRPDCLSVLGLAREVATTYNRPLHVPTVSRHPKAKLRLAPLKAGRSKQLTVVIEDPDLCPRYAAAVAEITATHSPEWLISRLEAAGVRPISPIVDLTNYVNIELGQPMHAFDFDRLAGAEIRVRRAKKGETIRSLDNVERKLDPEMLVIADGDRAQAIAGVMGGAASEVSDSTRTVVFESACFKPTSVRRTSKMLQLKTEASIRFERGSDPNAPVVALQRIAALMEQIGAGRVVGPVVDVFPRKPKPSRLRLRRARLHALLGVAPPDTDVVRILGGLGLAPRRAEGGWDVVAPTFRVDLLREADLIEEVGRHYGLDKLDPTFPVVTMPAPLPDPRIARDRLVRRVLTAAGISEAVTFGFIEAKAAETFALTGGAAVTIANPLNAKFDTLRPSLIPGLVDAVAHNRRHGRRDVRLFEIGTRFAPSGETRGVGIAWTGNAGPDHWSGGAREVDFFDLKGQVEQLCVAFGVAVRLSPSVAPFLVAGQTATVDGPRSAALGLIGQITPHAADARGLPRQDRVFVAELNLDAIAELMFASDDKTRPLPRYPAVIRDLSIVVADALPAEIIRGTMHAAGAEGKAPLVAVAFFDRYQGKGVPEGSVSLSIRLTFQALDRTLTDADVQQSFERILAALVREHRAVQR